MLLKKALGWGLEGGLERRRGYLLVCSVGKVVHHHFEGDGLVCVSQKWLLVMGDEVEVVNVCELIDELWLWERLALVIDQPSCHIVVQGIRELVEQILGLSVCE